MALRIYNSLSGKKEEFVPLIQGEVGMYVCGVTVYDLCHLGHARAAIVFDIIFRYLRFSGYKVTYVRNFTDVDDKIINRANERGISSQEVAEENIKEFYTDMNALGIQIPTVEPKATEHIPEMLAMIQKLIDNGLAYAKNGNVFYSVRKFDSYGRLSKKKMDDLIAGARVDVEEDKKDPLDFALWKASKPGEPMWESPWGKGRPGWHIECSAMAQKYLGNVFDIHGGGRDLIFPHHENEIAQSFGATGVDPVRFWVHNGFVNINKEKMSKSLGNFFTIRDIVKEFDSEVIRFFLLSAHYRSPIDFTDQNLKEAKTNLDRFYDLFLFASTLGPLPSIGSPELREKIKESMDDDFNTAAVLGHMNTEMRHLNALREKVASGDAESIQIFLQKLSAIKEAGDFIGLFEKDPAQFFKGKKAKGLSELKLSEDDIEKQIEDRALAKKEKRWADADAIRDTLKSKGVTLLDSASGTEWKIKE